MPLVRLADAVFEAAQRRAIEGGFGSVDEYVTDIVLGDVPDADVDVQALFTPERLAAVDRGLADVRAGRVFTSEQLGVELAKRRAEWIETDGR